MTHRWRQHRAVRDDPDRDELTCFPRRSWKARESVSMADPYRPRRVPIFRRAAAGSFRQMYLSLGGAAVAPALIGGEDTSDSSGGENAATTTSGNQFHLWWRKRKRRLTRWSSKDRHSRPPLPNQPSGHPLMKLMKWRKLHFPCFPLRMYLVPSSSRRRWLKWTPRRWQMLRVWGPLHRFSSASFCFSSLTLRHPIHE